ncbi:MAG: tRNA 2-selenouridine(34) synthase MnmH [Nanoarchaeota archaeon]|nr:tRNA 2-selenouridine(34) synthase MnmH [Nanoarchaeota archaeon]MBU1644550.1 tRNA 2-selenouridine(34) synthase MnmH [Nanoarchaeota archaeon]MBU1976843.1 tRNA 2-selenouridine(34) synthase MnmH [Nanoarchaeota archaeon]
MVEQITIKEAFKLKEVLFIDARTPKEFEEDHILEAVNVPLLSDEERHEIGIIYKQKSREEAIEKGLQYFPSKIPSIYNAVKEHKDKTIIVYCARGGMRSKIIASLLESLGYKVLQLEGGYKLFRHYILEELNNFKLKPKIVCLYGLTCTGKTDLLKKLPSALDLEELAQHRGSLFGAVGLKPRSQKKFENLLLKRLKELNSEKVIFTEGESRKIGNVEIPPFLFKAMKKGRNILITRSLEKRIAEAVREYFATPEMAEEIKKITPTLRDIISKKKKEEIVRLIEEKKFEDATKILLEEYYDLLYVHTLNKQNFSFEVNNDDLEKAAKEIVTIILNK